MRKRRWESVSWARPEGIHLTLKFLGETDEAKIDEIGRLLNESAQGIKPMRITATGIGGFPNLRNPRVLWVGIKGPEELEKLQLKIDASLENMGFQKEDRPFHPHLTVCRIKSYAEGKELGKAAGQISFKEIGFTAGSFIIYKSVLNPKGAEYTPLKVIELKGQ